MRLIKYLRDFYSKLYEGDSSLAPNLPPSVLPSREARGNSRRKFIYSYNNLYILTIKIMWIFDAERWSALGHPDDEKFNREWLARRPNANFMRRVQKRVAWFRRAYAREFRVSLLQREKKKEKKKGEHSSSRRRAQPCHSAATRLRSAWTCALHFAHYRTSSLMIYLQEHRGFFSRSHTPSRRESAF
jgi:hypothetical protein